MSSEVDKHGAPEDKEGEAMTQRAFVILMMAFLGGCVPPGPAQQAAPASPSRSPLEPGIYAGQIQLTDQSLNQIGFIVSETTRTQTVPLTISVEGIVVLDGAEVIQGQSTTVDLGHGVTATAFRRTVEVTPEGLVITSDLSTSSGPAGVAVVVLTPAESEDIAYTVDIVWGDGIASFVSHGEGVLERIYQPE